MIVQTRILFLRLILQTSPILILPVLEQPLSCRLSHPAQGIPLIQLAKLDNFNGLYK
jgi:hypothetical protein